MKSDLYKSRSISSCLKKAMIMMLDNLSEIFRITWIPLLLLSIFFTGVLCSFTPNKQLLDWSNNHLALSFLLLIANYIAFSFCILWSFAKSYSFVNGLYLKDNLKRCFIPFLFSLAFGYLIISCFAGNIHKWIIIGITVIHFSSKSTNILIWLSSCFATIIICGAILPLQYAFTRYIIDSKMKLSNIFKIEYKIGLHYWGYLFVSTLITTLIMALITIVIATPLAIIFFANICNSYGIITGDSDGTPSYFNILLFITSIACSFIILFISLWQLYTNCYICGSIKTRYTKKQNHEETEKQYEATENIIY